MTNRTEDVITVGCLIAVLCCLLFAVYLQLGGGL